MVVWKVAQLIKIIDNNDLTSFEIERLISELECMLDEKYSVEALEKVAEEFEVNESDKKSQHLKERIDLNWPNWIGI